MLGAMTTTLLDLEGLVFLRREAHDRGYTDQQIARLVRSGEWWRVRRGAYVAGDVWGSLGDADRARLRSRAVLKAAHPSTVLTHVSAALEWGAPVWGYSLDEVHTSRPETASGRREAGIVHHRGLLPPDHVTQVNGVRLTTPLRCALELSALGSVEQALVSVNALMHARLVEPGAFSALAHELRHWPGTLGVNLVSRLADPRLESAGESRTAYFIWAHHLPRPVPQYEVHDGAGRVLARLDFAWPEHGVFLEFDGMSKYREHRRPGESVEDYLLREKRREELVSQMTGWTCLRLRWADLDRPHELASRIRRVLAQREG